MYEITLNGKTLYHPNSTDCIISNAVIHEALNDAGYMDITIPFSNPLFNEIEERKGSVIVYKDNVPIWYGQINEVSLDFSKNKTLYVVGEAAYLNDTVQPQKLYDNKTKYEIFSSMLEEHNKMVDPDKQFEPGIVGHNDIKPMTVITNWEYTLDSIRSNLCEDQEYIRVRHLGGVRYLDIMPLENYGKRTDQSILFGDNMLDYTEKSTSSGIATICIPLGSRLDESPIEDVDAYVTCESANGGKNYVELPGAVNRLGRITRVVHFDVLDSPSSLVTAATNWLQSAQYSKLTLELSAVDLSVLHSDIDNYAVGDYVRAICEPMGMDAWFPIRERETDLLNLANNKIVIGSEGTKSITTQNSESITELEKIMPNKDSILTAAKKNATALINGAGDNGYVVFHTNDDGVVYEILVMDAKKMDDASRMWRWNENGFGYRNRKTDGTWNDYDVAMTMDGAIVANFITTGILRIGGLTGNVDGAIEVYRVEKDKNTGKDVEVLAGKFDSDGVNVFGGTITGSTINGSTIQGGSLQIGSGSRYCKISSNGDIASYDTGDGTGVYLYGLKSDGRTVNVESLWGAYKSHAYKKGMGSFVECYTYDIVSEFDTNSDVRIKDNIETIDTEVSNHIIDNSNVYSFNIKREPDVLRYGVIAQEVIPVLEEIGVDTKNVRLVHKSINDMYRVEYEQYIPHLINYVKELRKELDALRKEIKHD